jgi:hypothetical protein
VCVCVCVRVRAPECFWVCVCVHAPARARACAQPSPVRAHSYPTGPARRPSAHSALRASSRPSRTPEATDVGGRRDSRCTAAHPRAVPRCTAQWSVAACCNMLHRVATCCIATALCSSALECVACSVSQQVASCRSVCWRVAPYRDIAFAACCRCMCCIGPQRGASHLQDDHVGVLRQHRRDDRRRVRLDRPADRRGLRTSGRPQAVLGVPLADPQAVPRVPFVCLRLRHWAASAVQYVLSW